MSKDKEEKKDTEVQENSWYGARPTLRELYRRYNEPGNSYFRSEGESPLFPDYKREYDLRTGENVVSGPLQREFAPRLEAIKNRFKRMPVATPEKETPPPLPLYPKDMPSLPDEEEIFSRIPRASKSPSETFGQYIMRPQPYEEQERLFNSPGLMKGGGFMPYHGTSVAPPDTISSFFGGVGQFVKRMDNDARYFRGKTVANYFDERDFSETIGKILQRSEERGKTLYDLSDEDMFDMMRDIRQEQKSIERGDIVPEELYGKSTGQYLASLDRQLNTLQNLIKAQSTFAGKEKYEDYINSIYKYGGRGMQIMSEANTIKEQTPIAKGWAKAGDVTANVLESVVPLLVRLYSPVAGTALLIASLSANAGSTMSEASMEVDEYEKQTGQKISDMQRSAYVLGVGSADLLLDAFMQRYFFRNIPQSTISNFRRYLRGNILSRKEALEEVKELVDLISSTRKQKIYTAGRNMLNASMMQSGTDAAQSLIMDLLTTIYRDPQHYPALTSVISNAAISAGIGFLVGGPMDLMSRRFEPFSGPRGYGNKEYVTYVDDMHGNSYQYLGMDSRTGMFRVLDENGEIRYLVPNNIVSPRTITRKDYLDLASGSDKKSLLKKPLELVKKFKWPEKPVLKEPEPEIHTEPVNDIGNMNFRFEKVDPQADADGTNRKKLLNYNKMYKTDDKIELNEMLDRLKLGKVFFDKDRTGALADFEFRAPEREDMNMPRPDIYDYRPGRQKKHREVYDYDDAPFLSGDELTWRMFNPEDGDIWLKNNPFFDSTRTGHNFAIETPVKSPHRPFHYHDVSLSDEDYIKLYSDEMKIGNDKYDFNKKDPILDSVEELDLDYETESKYTPKRTKDDTKDDIKDNIKSGYRGVENPIKLLRVNGEYRIPYYRHERGTILPIPDAISPYEDKILQAKELSNRLRLKTRLYRTFEDVPSKLRKELKMNPSTTGFYNPYDKEIGIIIDNSTVRDIQEDMLRLGIVNRGLKGVLGDKTKEFLESVYDKIPEKYKKYYYDEYSSLEGGAAAYLIDVATNPNMDDSAWNSFSADARRALWEKYGIKEIEDVDLRYMLWAAVNKIREDDSIKEMQKKNVRARKMLDKIKDDNPRRKTPDKNDER